MSLELRINEEIKSAAKAGDKLRLETIRSIRAAILEFLKSGENMELTKEIEDKILLNAAKKRRDAIEMYDKAGRFELSAKEHQELEIINEFLPRQMTEDEVTAEVSRMVAETGATDMKDLGKVMGLAMAQLKGKADGKLVQQIVKNILTK
jgi:uncharacterized protein YqeY